MDLRKSAPWLPKTYFDPVEHFICNLCWNSCYFKFHDLYLDAQASTNIYFIITEGLMLLTCSMPLPFSQ